MFIFLEKQNFDWVYKYPLELNFEYIHKHCCSCSTVLSLSEWLVMDVVRCSSSLLQCLSIDDLPECLLIEILTRLPLKSIFQCKCVSCRWCSLISTPFAYIVHRLRSSSILQRPSTLVISHYIDGVRLPRMLK